MESKESGMKDIPGVLGPIEEPYERERRRVYADPTISIPMYELKSHYNPLPLFNKLFYYSFEYPIDLIHSFLDSSKVLKPQPYYHQKYPRVPNIWECKVDDTLCIYEAEVQFRRDMKIDQEIISIMERRLQVCRFREGLADVVKCKDLLEAVQRVKSAWQIKYGDLGIRCNARHVLQKQKNRFIEDRYLARMNKNKLPKE